MLERVVNVGGKVTGERQRSMTALYECRVRGKANCIVKDASHVLAKHYDLLPSGRRFRAARFSTVRGRSSFIPSSIKILNSLS